MLCKKVNLVLLVSLVLNCVLFVLLRNESEEVDDVEAELQRINHMLVNYTNWVDDLIIFSAKKGDVLYSGHCSVAVNGIFCFDEGERRML